MRSTAEGIHINYAMYVHVMYSTVLYRVSGFIVKMGFAIFVEVYISIIFDRVVAASPGHVTLSLSL